MCLYSKMILNPKYLPNKKNGFNPPRCDDERKRYVPIGCGNCIECRKKTQREWQVRLMNEMKYDKTGQFITLTFSEEGLKKVEEQAESKEANIVAGVAVRKFLERWRKKYKKSVKHWFITELGHEGTKRLHLHGIIYTEKTNEEIQERWGYGITDLGYEMSQRTINYIIKYITKPDNDNKGFRGKIFTSKGLGKKYLESWDAKNNAYRVGETREYIKLPTGSKTALPIYYRNKLYTEDEREKLWIEKLDKDEAYVMGRKIKNVSTTEGQREMWEAIQWARRQNKEQGYGEQERKKKKFLTKEGKCLEY